MDVNPYEAPKNPTRAPIGIKGGRRKDVRDVAVYQKGIMICILIYLGGVAVQVGATVAKVPLPQPMMLALGIVMLLNGLTGVVFVFLLSMKVYHPVGGVFLAILALVPCVGLLVLLMVSSKATATLRANGYEVGFLGANLNDFPK